MMTLDGKKAGFTLIEIAIVVVIIGILMIPLAHLYEVYLAGQKLETTKDNINDVSAQIAFFPLKAPLNRLPCPSDRGLAPSDPGYQQEFIASDAAGDGGCTLPAILAKEGWTYAPLPAHNAPLCTPNFGFCLVEGYAGDRDGDGYTDPVLIGGVPIKTINAINNYNFSTSKITDGWGGTLTYAVTLNQTLASGYKPGNGAIRGLDENGYPTAGINDDGDYALISHGADNIGAFSPTGAVIHGCNTPIDGKDYNNCNHDASFVEALGIYSAPGPDHFDDIAYFGKSKEGSLWKREDNAFGTTIYNTNFDNVGIGTDTPTEKLDVVGIAHADNKVKTSLICDASGVDCFNVTAITNGIVPCSGNQVMIGLYTTSSPPAPPYTTPTYTTKANCATLPAYTQPVGTCPAGKWLHGFQSDGSIICWP